jgi:hypothetical protein
MQINKDKRRRTVAKTASSWRLVFIFRQQGPVLTSEHNRDSDNFLRELFDKQWLFDQSSSCQSTKLCVLRGASFVE